MNYAFMLASILSVETSLVDGDIVSNAAETSEMIQESVEKIGISKMNPILVKIISIGIVILFTFAIYRLVHHFIKKYIFESNSEKITGSHVTNANLIFNVLKTLLFVFSIIIILDIVGINITGLVAGLGVMGAVAGLAAQDLLKDLIAGANIASEKYFVIGDMVECQGYTGIVTAISMRSVKLKMIDGSIVSIQNHLIDKARVVSTENNIKVQLPYDLERPKAYALIDEIVEKTKKIPEVTKAMSAGISSFEDSAIHYMILFSCAPDVEPRIRRKINDIIIKELDVAGVEIPFNQIDIHQK